MQIDKWDFPLSSRACNDDPCIQRRQRNAHVRGMRRHAGWRRAQNGMIAIEAVNRVTTAIRNAFVAARGIIIVEIEAPRTLQDIATNSGHISDLRRSSSKDRLRQHRIALPHAAVGSNGCILYACADPKLTVCCFVYLARKT